jgi:hypothetical protein
MHARTNPRIHLCASKNIFCLALQEELHSGGRIPNNAHILTFGRSSSQSGEIPSIGRHCSPAGGHPPHDLRRHGTLRFSIGKVFLMAGRRAYSQKRIDKGAITQRRVTCKDCTLVDSSNAAPVPEKTPRSFHVSAIFSLSHSSRRSHGPFAIPCSRTFRTTSRHLIRSIGHVRRS